MKSIAPSAAVETRSELIDDFYLSIASMWSYPCGTILLLSKRLETDVRDSQKHLHIDFLSQALFQLRGRRSQRGDCAFLLINFMVVTLEAFDN